MICAVLAMGTVACSSDDSSSPNDPPEGASGEYKVVVSVTAGATLEQVMVTLTNGQEMDTDLIQEFNGQREWSKTYKKAAKQALGVTAGGFGKDENSKLTIKIMKGSTVVKESSGKGQVMSVMAVL
ncbi:hypothetical protein QNH98_10455 [Myroides sp. mNGS23_01]|nr:hypothetical protein [Myroides sp. mNGS23_01]WHT37620.1 hypothetical protein QNH98_10455 [Myroides sp. mNGS23_01]